MIGTGELRRLISSGGLDDAFRTLYGTGNELRQRARYARLLDTFSLTFGEADVHVFSVPGRAEITGNHTDHNHGAVLAAAINLDIIAIAAKRDDSIIKLNSENFPPDQVDLSITRMIEGEKETSQALIRGIGSRMGELGYKTGGFNCVTTSDVLKGSGLSSSAAFEVMVGTVFNHLYNGGSIDPVSIAIISSYAENNYFGKPSGLMDQTACASGGFCMIDFKNPASPELQKIDFDFSTTGYTLCAVDTGSSHHDLTSDYSSMPSEMRAVAAVFGKEYLREVDENEFLRSIPLVRQRTGDRAALRALHFFGEHKRVLAQRESLRQGDFEGFLKTIRQSGRSSFMYLQNVYSANRERLQPQSVALAMSDRFLGENGAFRVHGGGFAGIIMVFVPNSMVEDYTAFMEPVFGVGSVRRLSVREAGPLMLI